MLADNQKNSLDRILNLKTENSVELNPIKQSKNEETKYQCIVCQTNKISLSELHWHQTYQHSTEELSLSVIGWKGLVKIVDPSEELQEKENSTRRSIYSSFSKKPSQFYYLSSSILGITNNQKTNLETPIDCSLPITRIQEVKEEKIDKVLADSTMKEEVDAPNKWAKELYLIKEISMEDFVHSANELCDELKLYKRLTALKKATKRKNSS